SGAQGGRSPAQIRWGDEAPYRGGPGQCRTRRRHGSTVPAGPDPRGGRRHGQRRPAGRAAGRTGPGVRGGSGGAALPAARCRAAELAGAGTEVLVVNGAADPFGVPEAAGAVRVVVLPGATHALNGQGGAIRRVVGWWLSEVLARGSDPPNPPGGLRSGSPSPG